MGLDNIIDVSERNFSEVKAAEGKLVFMDFWAVWCGPCRMVAPILEKLAGEHKESVIVGKVNVDENQSLAASFNITSIPTVIVFKNGEAVEQVVGLHPYEQFKEIVDRFLAQ